MLVRPPGKDSQAAMADGGHVCGTEASHKAIILRSLLLTWDRKGPIIKRKTQKTEGK